VEGVGAFEARNEAARRTWDVERRIAHVVPAAAPLILDVGAHVGQSNQLFRRMFPAATIWSFEPDPDSFARLTASVDAALPGGCVQVAFADRVGTAAFHRNPIGHTNSLYARNPGPAPKVATPHRCPSASRCRWAGSTTGAQRRGSARSTC